MKPSSDRSPVRRFLGVGEASPGPLALLAMPAAPYTDSDVIDALQQQLDRVDQHSQRDTPEADEVRLALHAAAAQLLNPIVKQRLRDRWTNNESRPSTSQAASIRHPDAPASSMIAMERDIVLILGTSGGWNLRALRRITAIGHARGMTSEEIVAALSTLARRSSTPQKKGQPHRVPPAAVAGPVPSPLPQSAPQPLSTRHKAETAATKRAPTAAILTNGLSPLPRSAANATERPAPPDPVRRLAILALLALVGVGVTVVGAVLLAAPRSVPLATEPAPAVSIPAPLMAPRPAQLEVAGEAIARPTLPPISDTGDPRGTTRDLRAAADALAGDATAAASRFDSAYARLSRQWPSLPPDQRVAAADAVLEFLYRAASQTQLAQRVADAIAAPHAAILSSDVPSAEQVLPSIWSAAMLARLQRESDLPSSVRQRLAAGSAADPAASPPSAALSSPLAAATSRWPKRLIGQSGRAIASADAWQAWLTAVEAVGIDDPPLRPRLILDALERLLSVGPSPERDRAALAIVTELTTRLTWRADEGSRPWLLRILTDPSIPPGGVRAVTLAIARQSKAEGVDATMILSGAAGQFERAELRERYAAAWNLSEAMVQSDTRNAWLAAANEALGEILAGRDDLQRIARLATLARLHQAAAELARGDANAAALSIVDARAPIDAIVASAAAAPAAPPADLSDGAWAERFLGARASPRARRDMLYELSARNAPLGQIDAEVLLAEALTAPGETRGIAMELLKRRASDLAVVAALLERLPRMARTTASAALIEAVTVRTLPPARDPAWPTAARRALVERAGDLLAAQGERAAIDRLAELITAAYAAQVIGVPAVEGVEPSSALYQMLRGQIDPLAGARPGELSLDAIDRRRVARLAIARGPMQRFAADQASIAELRALSTIVSRPARARAADQIIADLDRLRREDRSILDQLVHAEAAIIRLWILALEDDAT